MWRSAVVVCLLSAVAIADDAAKDPVAVAAEYVSAGEIAQKNRDYATAIGLYERALELSKHPALHYNLGQAHRMWWSSLLETDAIEAAKHRDLARKHYGLFLETKPTGDLEVHVKGWKTKLDEEWAKAYPKEEAARLAEIDRVNEQKIEAERERLAEERAKQAKRDAIERERIAMAVTATESESLRSKARTVRFAGIGGVALGAVGIGIGAYFGLKARGIANDLSAEDVYDQERISDGNAAERYMAISTIAGGALLLGGGITYWIGHRMGVDAERRPVMGVDVSTGRVSVGLSGRF